MKKIVFTGGGTLGHVMPNLYLMEELTDFEHYYIGSNGIEKNFLKGKIKNYYEIPVIKLVRGKVFKNLKIPFVLISSILKAKKVLKQIKPEVIFSKGGYVSLPVCIAGRMLKIPIVAHESDSSFGLANKVILKVCNKMCVNFKSLERKNKKIVYTGPIFSKEFENINRNKAGLHLHDGKQTILIIGGSLGSIKINEMICATLKDLLKDFNIIHITGKNNNLIKSYDNYNSFEMTKDINNLYNLADFVIGRSGAGVTAECYFKNLPMILIPLENKSTRGDQVLNAEYYQKQGVATILKESDLTPTKLYNSVINFSKNLDQYKQKYKKQIKINGKEKVLQLIKEYLYLNEE